MQRPYANSQSAASSESATASDATASAAADVTTATSDSSASTASAALQPNAAELAEQEEDEGDHPLLVAGLHEPLTSAEPVAVPVEPAVAKSTSAQPALQSDNKRSGMTVEDTQPLISHLIELRTRLLRAIISILVIFLCLVWFSNDIYAWVSAPLVERMPHGASMIATEVASPFIAPIKLTLLVSVFLAAPLVLYQVWGFIAPALYRHERRLILPLLVSSSALFYLGMLFAYYVVFPLILVSLPKRRRKG